MKKGKSDTLLSGCLTDFRGSCPMCMATKHKAVVILIICVSVMDATSNIFGSYQIT